jgi:hypothetical protein
MSVCVGFRSAAVAAVAATVDAPIFLSPASVAADISAAAAVGSAFFAASSAPAPAAATDTAAVAAVVAAVAANSSPFKLPPLLSTSAPSPPPMPLLLLLLLALPSPPTAALLLPRGLKTAAVESCVSGLLASVVTAVAEASEVDGGGAELAGRGAQQLSTSACSSSGVSICTCVPVRQVN